MKGKDFGLSFIVTAADSYTLFQADPSSRACHRNNKALANQWFCSAKQGSQAGYPAGLVLERWAKSL